RFLDKLRLDRFDKFLGVFGSLPTRCSRVLRHALDDAVDLPWIESFHVLANKVAQRRTYGSPVLAWRDSHGGSALWGLTSKLPGVFEEGHILPKRHACTESNVRLGLYPAAGSLLLLEIGLDERQEVAQNLL